MNQPARPTDGYQEVGPAGEQSADEVLAALRLPSRGEVFSLALPRYTGMPLFGSHPPFQVTMYRTPGGLRGDGVEPWGPVNEVNLQYMAENVSGTAHSGAHVDALAHMTIGEDDHWYGGGNAREHLGDRGPTVGDGSKLPPFIRRGVLLDVPGFLGVDALDAHQAVSAEQLQQVAEHQGVAVRAGDVVLIRTGYLGAWPDPEAMARHVTAGPDLSAARWLLDQGVVATGTDTETYEVQPAPDPGSPANPQPVHTLLLIEHGIYLFEGIYLEELARAGVHEFLFVALPLKINGTTGSMLDPVAIV
ncbi:cyclase family protein [Nocardioides anomalus]|uniref:Cyclase family protein n=1 Tax=Nocardioides anomalus TaxID=2712223 RepID=A0A6G6WJ95_9ACTN|nr:cyclase family protein [Nocardioides anomalus]QIG45165.1 cyclase family protein [Nocardioides anomalus]